VNSSGFPEKFDINWDDASFSENSRMARITISFFIADCYFLVDTPGKTD
jgi:hypothetical protein